jgi:hypothetical protein
MKIQRGCAVFQEPWQRGGRPARLWLRRLDATSARPPTGTDHASLPFWSPDSQSVAFFADSKLKRIDIDSGLVQVLAPVPVPAGGTWNRDGVILFPMVPDSSLFRISAKGGGVTPLTQLESRQTVTVLRSSCLTAATSFTTRWVAPKFVAYM